MFRWSTGLRLLGVALLAFVLPSPAFAHPGGEPFIHVPLTDVAPGSSFPVIVADLGPDQVVTFELLADPSPVALGTAPGSPDGHFETTLVLPATIPDGYVQLRATVPDGTQATTWIQVRAGAVAPPSVAGDDFATVPLLTGALALAALAFLLYKTRHRTASPPVPD